jgi:hypothetical protein
MPVLSPQLGVVNTITLTQADIQQLNTVPKLIIPGNADYCSVLVRAQLIYQYRNTVFSNVNNLLNFYLVPSMGSPILISNSLNATNILGLAQGTSTAFIAANPYTPLMSTSSNSTIVLKIEGSDPTGGDPASTLSVQITFNIHQLT